MYFNIQRFSTHDGDGIRSVLFLKGCNLSCPWCQNPEGRSRGYSLLFDERYCLRECQLCTQICSCITRINNQLTINRTGITKEHLIALKNACPTRALTVCGKKINSDVLFKTLIKDKPFYDQSNGGITFSGGEPLIQADLVTELAKKSKDNKITTAIESCLHVPWKNIEKVNPYIDCWLTDLKHTNEKKFSLWTKGSLKRIKDNFHQLSSVARRIIIRVPVIPEFNDTEEELQEIIKFSASLENCKELHLLPYHTLGIHKYHLLNMPYKCSPQPLNNTQLIENIRQYINKYTQLKLTVRG